MFRLSHRRTLWVLVAALGATGVPTLVRAQSAPAGQGPRRDWEPKGFDFTPDGVWRKKARVIWRAREAAMARGDFSSLNRPMLAAAARGAPLRSTMALSDTLRIPVLLVRFKDTDTTLLRAPTAYDSVLLGTTPPYGRPYTVRTFYTEMSHGLMTVEGVIIGWITLDSTNVYYAGPGTCDGLCASGHVAQLIQRAVMHADSMGLDWGQFDNDGPDGIPNSGDDDGIVDLVWLIHPKQGAECNVDGDIWSHRWYYSGWTGAPLTTRSSRAGGGKIVVDNYTIQSGVGGITGCDPTQIMAPGTIGHETGHGLDLPDLYDTGLSTEGIGEWGLMGSGNWARPFSPSHMESFSLSRLGWITIVPIAASGTFQVGPVETSDTAFLIRPTAPNPRGEYFLLENRQAVLADTALVAKHGGGGLLIWHVDSTQYARATLPWNTVNDGTIHGVALEQADGLDNLDCTYPSACNNRGDGGDPYPGTTDNTVFGPSSKPAATLNSDGSFAGIVVDSIRQVVPGGAMAFRVTFGAASVVSASDTSARVQVDGAPVSVYRDVWVSGSMHTISVDSVQTTPSGTKQFAFVSWSDGGARSHTVTGSLSGATYTAAVSARYLAEYAVAGGGSVSASRPIDPVSGGFLPAGDSVSLVATPASGQTFVGWTGDTTASNATLKLRMTRPYEVTATFASPGDVVSQLLTGTSPINPTVLMALDQLGNKNGRFDLGDLVAWLDRNPALAASPAVLKLLREIHR